MYKFCLFFLRPRLQEFNFRDVRFLEVSSIWYSCLKSQIIISHFREVAFTRELNKIQPSIKHYYLGFYIHSCPKMRYKARIRPSDLLCPETYQWFPLEKSVEKLEVNKYSRLNEDANAQDENLCTQSDYENMKVLSGYRIVNYHQLGHRSREKKQFQEIGRLLGKKCIENTLIALIS